MSRQDSRLSRCSNTPGCSKLTNKVIAYYYYDIGNIFNEGEKIVILKEFIYNEDHEKNL